MAKFMLYHVSKFQLNHIRTFSAASSWLGHFGPPLGFTISFEYLYITFLFLRFQKKEHHHCNLWIFLEFLIYQAQNSYFSKKIIFLTDLIKKFEKKIKKFFKLETCDRYQTTANFVLYHVVKCQLNRISRFYYLQNKFSFLGLKSHIHFWGMAKN